ncbi:hypothetical protein [Roseovarius sp. SYSU LYC5161]|uniref:hypothetical protein n=1 Tax=Roseovarius halophilus (ex Wu et al. 2025) TaxID=3376060 RepID=UPI0028714168|nr:hypothetical protein [Roseovarius sp.]
MAARIANFCRAREPEGSVNSQFARSSGLFAIRQAYTTASDGGALSSGSVLSHGRMERSRGLTPEKRQQVLSGALISFSRHNFCSYERTGGDE